MSLFHFFDDISECCSKTLQTKSTFVESKNGCYFISSMWHALITDRFSYKLGVESHGIVFDEMTNARQMPKCSFLCAIQIIKFVSTNTGFTSPYS